MYRFVAQCGSIGPSQPIGQRTEAERIWYEEPGVSRICDTKTNMRMAGKSILHRSETVVSDSIPQRKYQQAVRLLQSHGVINRAITEAQPVGLSNGEAQRHPFSQIAHLLAVLSELYAVDTGTWRSRLISLVGVFENTLSAWLNGNQKESHMLLLAFP